MKAEESLEESSSSIDELLQLAKDDQAQNARHDEARLRRFTRNASQQQAMLESLDRELAEVERRNEALSDQFESNEADIEDLQERLRIRTGNFGELFGVVRQMSVEAKEVVDGSLVSAQHPGRGQVAAEVAESRALPSIDDLKDLQIVLLEEMVESGRVARFDADFFDAEGVSQRGEVVRVGAFTLIHEDEFVSFEPDTGTLQVLARQPASRFRNQASDLFDAQQGPVAMAIDPTRGTLLNLFIQTPTLGERVQQGREVGYVIIAMGVAGLVIALWRLVLLYQVRRKVRMQLASSHAERDNPLGRILATYDENRHKDLDAVSLALDEAIIRETFSLERFQGIIKVFAALAPLLGLLGTVVGMILTFQQLTLFGTGDPKLMAGGISQALVTTVLGLTAAIPLILLHSVVASTSRQLVELLEEQSVGLIAKRASTTASLHD